MIMFNIKILFLPLLLYHYNFLLIIYNIIYSVSFYNCFPILVSIKML